MRKIKVRFTIRIREFEVNLFGKFSFKNVFFLLGLDVDCTKFIIMGLSIHYSGKIKSKDLIPALIKEVKKVCLESHWTNHVFNDHKICGICFTPPGCETVFLTFNNQGRLVLPLFLDEEIFTISTKTQYAGYQMHLAIINLLKYLEAEYFQSFELSDEGYYWETGNENLLIERFGQYDQLVNLTTAAIKDCDINVQDPHTMAELLEKFLNQKFNEIRSDGISTEERKVEIFKLILH